jgi:hypothetical protein
MTSLAAPVVAAGTSADKASKRLYVLDLFSNQR